ncbi:MAG: energy transducer TonB [Pyrinomonadaceae bacterium]
MHTRFLQRGLPFVLTFVIGAAAGGFFKLFQGRTAAGISVLNSYRFHEGDVHRGCARARRLLAESKPLVILFKPDARYPRAVEGDKSSVRVSVTFGADGKVQKVEHLELLPDATLQAVERAARQIQFTPQTINSVPVSVTKDVEIHFMPD